MKTIIITDSTSDMDLELAKKLSVKIVPLSVTFGDKNYIDGVDLTKKEFFEMQAKSEVMPVTSQANPESFLKIFEECKENNQDLVYISIASKLSGTMQSALIAKQMCEYENIFIVDSKTATFGESCLIEIACKLRDEGRTAKEIYEELMVQREKLKLYAVVDTLKYLIMGGRVSKSAGIIGNVLNLKPIISIEDGEVLSISKARGRKKAFSELYLLLQNEDIDYSKPIYIGHTNNEELALSFYEFLKSKGLNFESKIQEIGTVIGTHAGPDCVGIAYFLK